MQELENDLQKIIGYATAALAGILAGESERLSPDKVASHAFKIGKAMLIQDRMLRERVAADQSYLVSFALEIEREDDDLGA